MHASRVAWGEPETVPGLTTLQGQTLDASEGISSITLNHTYSGRAR